MSESNSVSWAAGLFEGEGSMGVSSDQGQPRLALAMTDEDVVRRFAEIVGRGNVRRYEPYGADGYRARRKPQWQWSVQSAEDVGFVIGLFWSYFGERRRQRASEVLERVGKIGEQKGFCKRGHDLADPQHLYLHRKTGKRHCRTCRNAASRRWQARLGN